MTPPDVSKKGETMMKHIKILFSLLLLLFFTTCGGGGGGGGGGSESQSSTIGGVIPGQKTGDQDQGSNQDQGNNNGDTSVIENTTSDLMTYRIFPQNKTFSTLDMASGKIAFIVMSKAKEQIDSTHDNFVIAPSTDCDPINVNTINNYSQSEYGKKVIFIFRGAPIIDKELPLIENPPGSIPYPPTYGNYLECYDNWNSAHSSVFRNGIWSKGVNYERRFLKSMINTQWSYSVCHSPDICTNMPDREPPLKSHPINSFPIIDSVNITVKIYQNKQTANGIESIELSPPDSAGTTGGEKLLAEASPSGSAITYGQIRAVQPEIYYISDNTLLFSHRLQTRFVGRNFKTLKIELLKLDGTVESTDEVYLQQKYLYYSAFKNYDYRYNTYSNPFLFQKSRQYRITLISDPNYPYDKFLYIAQPHPDVDVGIQYTETEIRRDNKVTEIQRVVNLRSENSNTTLPDLTFTKTAE